MDMNIMTSFFKNILGITLGIMMVHSPEVNSDQKSGFKNEIAVCLPGTVEFFGVEKKGMDKAAKEFNLQVTYSDAEWDAGAQLSQIENFLSKGVRLILLCSVDNYALIPAVSLCKNAGVPLFTFTNVIGQNPDGAHAGVVTYIGTNDKYLGNLLGEMAERILGNNPANIILIEGDPGTSPQRMRTEGFHEIVSMHPAWKIIYSQGIPRWTKEGALTTIEAFLQSGKRADLIACHWHGAASAAAIALKENKNVNKIHIIGLEFTKELAGYIRDGIVDMTSYNSIYSTGYTVIETAAKYLKGEKISPLNTQKVIIVTKENVNSIMPEF
jgi:ribose transport system substrate-binding protein